MAGGGRKKIFVDNRPILYKIPPKCYVPKINTQKVNPILRPPPPKKKGLFFGGGGQKCHNILFVICLKPSIADLLEKLLRISFLFAFSKNLFFNFSKKSPNVFLMKLTVKKSQNFFSMKLTGKNFYKINRFKNLLLNQNQ